MSRITGPLHLLSNKLQDDEKELVMGYGVEVVPCRLGPEVVPGQRLPGGLSDRDIRHRDLPPTPPEPRIFGLRRITFALVIALIVVTIAGAIAAGVEASTVARCRANTKSSISSPDEQGNGTLAIKTVTVTMAVPAPTAAGVSPAPDNANNGTATTSGLVVPTGTLALNCPDLDRAGQQTIRIGTNTWFFNSMCGTDFAGHNIVGIISYSLSNCMQACVMYNLFYGENNCVAVHFAADMVSSLASNFANCWLKNGTETNLSQRQGNLVITAFLANTSMLFERDNGM